MRYTWDEGKRARTLRDRQLDFADAERLWAGVAFTVETYAGTDPVRYLTIGTLGDVVALCVWTPRGEDERRVISMRKAHVKERALYQEYAAQARREHGSP